MINSFADQLSEEIFHGLRTHMVRERFPLALIKVAERKLDLLNCTDDLDVLFALPEHRNNRAGRDRHGKTSIPIDDRWCIQFRWSPKSVEDVEILIA